MCKYLERRGFFAYVFGKNPETGLVDVEAGDYTVVEGVSEEAAKQIIQYLKGLEGRVEEYFDLFYDIDINK